MPFGRFRNSFCSSFGNLTGQVTASITLRYLQEVVKTDLTEKMVFIGGPRQVGKTTFALSFLLDIILQLKTNCPLTERVFVPAFMGKFLDYGCNIYLLL